MDITNLLLALEVIEKVPYNNVYKYIIYDKANAIWHRSILLYYHKGELNHIMSTFYHHEGLKRNNCRQFIGHCWKSAPKLDSMYPRILTCYWTNCKMVIPITEKIALSYNTIERKVMQSQTPMLQMNCIKDYSIELPISISIEVLQILIEAEKRKLNMCLMKPKASTQTLNGAINLLGQCNITNSTRVNSFREQLGEGVYVQDYHSSVITICEYILKNLKVTNAKHNKKL